MGVTMSMRKILSAATMAAMMISSTAPAAASVPMPSQKQHPVIAVQEDGQAGHRGRGWGRHRHHDRIDAGDVFAGVAILGGLAILIGAASEADKQAKADRYPDRRYEDPRDDARYDDRGDYDNRDNRNAQGYGDYGSGGNVGLSQAVDGCTRAAEMQAGGGARVSEIRSVRPDGAGWRVAGDLSRGTNRGFTCTYGANGVQSVDF